MAHSRERARCAKLSGMENVRAYYEGGAELGRLSGEHIELARTKEILGRFLPPPPAEVLDVGGGPGVYAEWLAGEGYRVHVVDVAELHVREAATRPGVTASLGDARRLDATDESADVVLLFGPLYHLTERTDRIAALSEAHRVVRPGGLVAVAAISRFASLFDGLLQGFLRDAAFRQMVEHDLRTGQHRGIANQPRTFTTAFFHHPDELVAEIAEARLDFVELFTVEGPWCVLDDEDWEPELARWVARMIETEPSLRGLGGHLLAIARRP